MNTASPATNPDRKQTPQRRPARTQRSAPQTFILDTNILFLWVSGMTGTPHPSSDPARVKKEDVKRERATSFCESASPQRLFVIPPVVWVELYGVFLQKDIDVRNYALWRRRRKAALQPLERMIHDTDSFFRIGEEGLDHERAVEMCRAQASDALLAAWLERVGRTYDDGRPVIIKGLDGIDAAILAYAWSYAEAHPDREVCLVSDDNGLGLMVQELHRSASIGGEDVPPNLGFRDLWGRRYFPTPLSVAHPSPPPATSEPSQGNPEPSQVNPEPSQGSPEPSQGNPEPAQPLHDSSPNTDEPVDTTIAPTANTLL